MVSELPIVGVGGVESGRHALELIAVGASAVGLGTILFREPGAPARVRAELACELASRGLSDVAQARGIAHARDGALLPA
jgi:dihydroorotate dehydrogenase (NAD+) catalytic subunit